MFLAIKRHLQRLRFLIVAVLVLVMTLLLHYAQPLVQAGTCASNCGSTPLQFAPSEPITVEITNLTASLVEVQEIGGSHAVPLYPGRQVQLPRLNSASDNASIVFWNVLGLPIRVQPLKSGTNKLTIQLLSGSYPPGDRAVYLRNDGRVNVL